MLSLKQLKSLNNEELLQVAKRDLKFVGQGRARDVYEFDESNVIKIAKNEFGFEQNEKESSSCSKNGPVPKIVSKADDYSWIIMQKAKLVSNNEIDEILEDMSLDDVEGLKAVLYAGMYDAWTAKDPRSHARSKVFHDRLIKNNKWYLRFFQMIDRCELDFDEIRYDNLGVIDGELVMLDVGM